MAEISTGLFNNSFMYTCLYEIHLTLKKIICNRACNGISKFSEFDRVHDKDLIGVPRISYCVDAMIIGVYLHTGYI